jgi:hypothetical protein
MLRRSDLILRSFPPLSVPHPKAKSSAASWLTRTLRKTITSPPLMATIAMSS